MVKQSSLLKGLSSKLAPILTVVKQSGQRMGLSFTLVSILSVSLIIFMALTIMVVTAQSSHKKNFDQYLSAASEQQVLAHKISKYAVESGSGIEDSFVKLKEARDRSALLMGELKNGSIVKDLPPSPEIIQPTLVKVEAAWQLLESHVDSILLSQSVIVQADEIVSNMTSLLPSLIEVAGVASGQLVEQGTSVQIYHATRQLFLAQRIRTNLGEVLQGGPTTVLALDQLSQNTDELEIVVNALISGDTNLGVSIVKNEAAQNNLRNVLRQLAEVRLYRDELLGMIVELLPALSALGTLDDETGGVGLRQSDATAVMALASDNLAKLDEELMAFYSTFSSQIQVGFMSVGPEIAIGLFVVSGLLFLLLGYLLVSRARIREKQVANQNESSQSAIRKLLNEMGDLANGDLSIETTVSEDITGAIADSINASVESMRDVVYSINDTTARVSSSARKNQSTIKQLTHAAELQGREIGGASEISELMVETLEVMASKAELLAQVAADSLELTGKGGAAVFQNIDGMGILREKIQGTSKRIKRLGESSQEIGSIVGLINGITDQTNILAMNASMQAAAAGEAGRGFSLVADEVQRLAERSARATKQIETLVSAIQADTSEAVASMESSITEVLKGAGLTEEAGRVLEEIEKVSRQVTDDTRDVAAVAKSQSVKASNLRESMLSIRNITEQMSSDISLTENGILYQVDNVNKLRSSVAEFTLPEQK